MNGWMGKFRTFAHKKGGLSCTSCCFCLCGGCDLFKTQTNCGTHSLCACHLQVGYWHPTVRNWGGGGRTHASIIHGDTWKCSSPGEQPKKKKNSCLSWADVNTSVMQQLACGNDFFLCAVREKDVRLTSYCVWWMWNQGNSTHPITAFTSSKHPQYCITGKLLPAKEYVDGRSSLWPQATAYHWHAMKISDVMSSGSGPLILVSLGQIHV